MKRTLKNIRDQDIEVFIYHNPDVAVQIVNDLIDEPSLKVGNNGGMNNAIDKETKNLA
jgi:hypothetical protein